MDAYEATRCCHECGIEAAREDRFCTGCGTTLEAERPSEEPKSFSEPLVDQVDAEATNPERDRGAATTESAEDTEKQVPSTVDEGTSTVQQLGESVRRGAGGLSAAASDYAGRYGPQVAQRLPAPVRRAFSGPVVERAGSRASGSLRSDALPGAIAAFVTAWALLILVYIFLAVNGILSSELVPGNLGFTVFSALHGGDVFTSFSLSLFTESLDGGLSVGVPVTSFAVLVLGASFVLGRFFSARKSAGYGFALGFALTYGILCFFFALFGRVTVDEEFFSLNVYAGSLSTAFWGLILASVGAAAGVGSVNGTRVVGGVGSLLEGGGRWGLHVRRASEGAVVALLIGISPTVLFCVFDVLACGFGSALSEEGSCSGRGVLFALLPTLAGSTWLLSHGVPIGATTSFDLENFAGIASVLGASVPEIPTRLSLFGNWPFSEAWKLMVIVPAAALFAGGAVASRDAHRSDRIFQGALLSVPYTLLASVVSLLVGITASVTISDYAAEISLRVPAGYLLVVLLVAATFGGLGGYLSDNPRVASMRDRAAKSSLLKKVYVHGGRERVR